jgi:hypothetical protein
MKPDGYWAAYAIHSAAELAALRHALETRMRVHVFHEGEVRFECQLAWGERRRSVPLDLPQHAYHMAVRGGVVIENVSRGEAVAFVDTGWQVRQPGFVLERILLRSVKGDGLVALRYFARGGGLDFSVSKSLVAASAQAVVRGLNDAAKMTGHPENFSFSGDLTYAASQKNVASAWSMGLRRIESPERYVVSFRWFGEVGEGPVGSLLDVIRALPERPIELAEMTYQTPDGISPDQVENANIHVRRMIEREFGDFAGVQLNYAVGFSLEMDDAVTAIPRFLKDKQVVGEPWREDYCDLFAEGPEPIGGSGYLIVQHGVMVLHLNTNRDIEGIVFERTGMTTMKGIV